jgi:hypothetical protein
MGYYYLGGCQGGDPWRALKILGKFFLYAFLVGFVILLVKKILGNQP